MSDTGKMKEKSLYKKLDSIIGEGPDKKSYLGEDDFVEAHHRDIRIMFHLRNRVIDLSRLIGTVRRIQEKLRENIACPLESVEIEIFQDRAEYVERHTHISEEDLPSWVQGDSGRVIRLIMDAGGVDTLERLQAMVTHECVHLALNRMTEGKVPAWLDEGLAIYFSQDLPEKYRRSLKNAMEADALFPMEVLEKPFARMDRKLKNLAYAQSAAVVDFLVEKYGWPTMQDLTKGVANGDSPEFAMRKAGLNYYLLEREWIRSIPE